VFLQTVTLFFHADRWRGRRKREEHARFQRMTDTLALLIRDILAWGSI